MIRDAIQDPPAAAPARPRLRRPTRSERLQSVSCRLRPRDCYHLAIQDLRQELSRPLLAALMGTTDECADNWKNRVSAPSRASQRLIWLLWCNVFLDRSLSEADWITWCRGETRTDLRGSYRQSRPRWHPNPEVLESQPFGQTVK